MQPPDKIAAQLFAELGVLEVTCPAYTLVGGNRPFCGHTGQAAEAFIRAFDKAFGGQFEPLGRWREDHGVWIRRYRRGARDYAVVYTTIASTFNVQVVCLKCR